MKQHRWRQGPAPALALRVDAVARRLWPGLLPPPPNVSTTPRAALVAVAARWVERWAAQHGRRTDVRGM